jgi:hypothetical protein
MTSGECTDSPFVRCPATYLSHPPTFVSAHLSHFSTQPPQSSFSLCSTAQQSAIEQRCQQQRVLHSYPVTSVMTTFKMTDTQTFRPDEVFTYICTRNTQEIAHLMRGFEEPATQAMFAATLLMTPRISAAPRMIPEKIKKAMNAFVGFRCKYQLLPSIV